MLADKKNVTVVDILLMPKHNDQELEDKRKINTEKEVEGCTFKPQTLDYAGAGQKQQETHGDKCLDLYKTKPIGWFKEKKYKESVDYEFERQEKDCTFAPQIIADPQIDHSNAINEVKAVDKFVERMNKAREQKFEKKLMTERGMPA